MTSPFEVIPAIDLRGRRVVRLEQGDFARETVFSSDAVAIARGFAESGARWLHVVDLDGARAGEPVQLDIVREVAESVGGEVAVEAAGGIRSIQAVDAARQSGARRVVFGTAALREPALVQEAIATFGTEAVAIAIDVRDGQAVGDAWQSGSPGRRPDEVLRSLSDLGAATFEVTAVDRDGLLGGPDLEFLERLVALGAGSVIASGGIRGTADMLAVREIGCLGAIVGRALYDGSLDLAAAIEALARP